MALHLSSPPKFWLALLEVLGLDELAQDDRFSTHTARVKNYDELRSRLQARFESRPLTDWLDALTAADVPHAPVLEPSEAVADVQFQHLQLAVAVMHPTEGPVKSIRPAHRFDGVTTSHVVAPPTLGEHNDSIREELAQRRRPALTMSKANAGEPC
jgi:crotonobetainyl-CoA:carnitine CoA-transferase CaiB-like acyl-CoA transferase